MSLDSLIGIGTGLIKKLIKTARERNYTKIKECGMVI